MSQSQFIYLFAFVAYLFAMVVVSWVVSRWQRSSDDFLLAGRQVPLLLTLGTTVATMVGTGSSMGAVGFAYQHAWAGALYGIGGALGILLLAWLFAPARAQAFATMSEELASYVGNKAIVKKLLAVLIYAASIGWLGAHLIGGGMYLSWLTGLDESSAKLLIGIGLAIYVSLGGYSAVVWTDSIQAIILFVGFLLMAYFALDVIGGWQALDNNHIAYNNGFLSYQSIGLLPALSMSLAILVGVLATPSFRQRIYSAHSVKSIRVSFAISGVLYLGFSLIPAIIGICAYELNDQLDNPAFAFPYIALNTLPAAMGGFILLAGISATLSSASSDAIAGVSVLVSDIYKWLMQTEIAPEKQLLTSRLAMLATVFTALGLALLSSDIVGYITKMVSVVLAGLCIMGLLGRFWPGYTWQGSLATLAGGSLAAVVVSTNSAWLAYFGNPIIPALLSALLLGVVVSLLSKNKVDDTAQPQVVS
ncbi:sodium:solute symporter family protein [Pseudoalteromonas sp. JBTF-M23]|uniref:Sodium:solute symporter family protein n=1 Tax=Pseudoalteromonas caenipelagi TaxID=2726988 RepID=A0A849VC07_9GAMM|nr:sodium:solute symporter family protein [Pseudoalteromonas caenipelagi]NOU50892.1 sodium:solute symporter family protein [Pseudoalteromonas caenipelagi]